MTTIGRFQLVARLSDGPLCAVYRAHDTVLDRQVALKILAAGAAKDAELRERFHREARICAGLRHPNLVPVFDIGQENGVPFIIMELIDGPNLRQMMTNEPAIPLDEKLRIVEAISEGLSYAHSMGVIHRDIKPSNVMVERNGQIRILDFGVALTPASSLTIAGTVLGTPQYMSPEQALGNPCDERSEIFALGILAFELITGTHPFEGLPVEDRTAFPANSTIGLSPEMLTVLRRAMRRAPEDRYGTVQEFAIALRSASQSNVPVQPLDETPLPAPKRRRIGGTETILSAVIVNLQRFEEAADKGDLSGAREAMVAMRQAGAGDTRYAIALEQSAKRLEELEHRKSVTGEKVPSPGEGSPTPPLRSGSFEATSLFEPLSAVSSVSIPSVSRPAFQTQPAFKVVAPAATAIVSSTRETFTPAPKPRRARSASWSSIIIAVLTACCALLGGAYFVTNNWRTTPKPLPFVATAEVVNVEAPLYSEPNTAAPPLAIAHHGDVMNILRAPRNPKQQWTELQWISAGKATPAVFAHTADLGNWSSTDPSLDETLRRMFPLRP